MAGEDTDCVIRYGQGAYPGLAPVFRSGIASLQSGLCRRPRAHGLERDASCPDWKNWLRSAGASTRIGDSGIRVNQSSLVLDAAIAGQGIGLGKLRLAEADLASGRLVSPFGAPQAVEFSYFFATSPHKSGVRRVELFRDWLEAEAATVQPIPPQSLPASVPALAAE
ncbi:DNA-binding transcriptional LysR family regulator [Devosia sp. UYZn731]|uniref:LysR substrate-binding domain-containing protein n=1 Tax=Devosia sp. UYZn731 TaxID=3156345 RepID=UPI003396CE9B